MRNMNKTAIVVSLSVLVLGLAVWPSCKSRERAAEEMAENLIERATGGKAEVDLGGRGMKVSTKEGDISWGEEAAWPADIPGDVPRFDQGKVTGVVRAHSAEAKNWSLVLSDVEAGGLARYAETLKGEGWEILVSYQAAEGETLTAQKGAMSVTLGFNKEQKAGTFHLAVRAE